MSEPDATQPPTRKTARLGHRFGERDFAVLINSLQAGMTMGEASKSTGFSKNVVYEWMARNPGKHDELKTRTKMAYLHRVQELGEKKEDWRAYAWMLERMWPGEFALTEVHRMEHSGAVEHQVKMLPESELLRMVARAGLIDAQLDAEAA